MEYLIPENVNHGQKIYVFRQSERKTFVRITFRDNFIFGGFDRASMNNFTSYRKLRRLTDEPNWNQNEKTKEEVGICIDVNLIFGNDIEPQ